MGVPTSRLIFPLHDRAATRTGVRLISYDRPGYGGSTARPGRTVADSAADVEAVADAVGIDRFGMWAFSGGPPFTLGVAAGLPDRVTRIVSLASPAPGMPPWAPFDPSVNYEADRAAMLAETVDDWLARLPAEFSAFAPFAIATLHIALAESAEGWIEDDRALGGAWGFEVSDVAAPVRLRHGRADRAVPVEHGEWLAAHLPNVDARITDDETHQAVHFRHLDEDFAWLADGAN